MFIQRNDSFDCVQCGKNVLPHPSSSRDHCPYCLTGLHVDNEPGDRANTCRGVLEPIGLEIRSGKQQIIYHCNRCQQTRRNIVAPDDNQERLVELSAKPIQTTV